MAVWVRKVKKIKTEWRCPMCQARIKPLGGFKPNPVTESALKWLKEDDRRTVYKAAKKFKIEQSTIWRAKERSILTVKCPRCGMIIQPARVETGISTKEKLEWRHEDADLI